LGYRSIPGEYRFEHIVKADVYKVVGIFKMYLGQICLPLVNIPCLGFFRKG
jgi:hypothetical protein